ncbi:MAG: leucyl/phenylalanyl-tRNA--protein transferase [Chloroflexota bacterium]
MPVFQLSRKLVFPPPYLADDDGLLAIGGDLQERRLLLAYSLGIFPWYADGYPIMWWSPDPRLVLFPGELHVSRSLRQTISKGVYHVTLDRAFEKVVENCARVTRKGERGTWITKDMKDAYVHLHRSGYAHSVESWCEGHLSGGLYGVALGGVFFGESMFTKMRDASKVAFVRLVAQLQAWGFTLIDCQIPTRHLVSLGAREISRAEFMRRLSRALHVCTTQGRWSFDSPDNAPDH